MAIFRRYVWNDEALQRKSRLYNWITVLCLITTVFVAVMSPMVFGGWVMLVFATVAFIFLMMSFKLQTKDKKLKKGRG